MRHDLFVDPNIQPAVPMVATVTVDRTTRFGFQASAHRLELIIGAIEDDEHGSTLHLVIEDAPEIVAALVALLSTGQHEVEKIGDSHRVVRLPHPRPHT